MEQSIVWADSGLARCLSTSRVELSTDVSFGFKYKGSEPEGRFVIYAVDSTGVLYRYDPDGTVHRMIEGLMIPNGILLSIAAMFTERYRMVIQHTYLFDFTGRPTTRLCTSQTHHVIPYGSMSSKPPLAAFPINVSLQRSITLNTNVEQSPMDSQSIRMAMYGLLFGAPAEWSDSLLLVN